MKHLVTVSQTFMIIVESVLPSFQKMSTITNAAQLMAKENNVQDYAIVEISEVKLRSRETYILLQFLYLSGNSNHVCVSRAPNFCGHCR